MEVTLHLHINVQACRKGEGGACAPQILTDQLTLSQPWGAHYAHQIRAPPDFQTLRRPWCVKCGLSHFEGGYLYFIICSRNFQHKEYTFLNISRSWDCIRIWMRVIKGFFTRVKQNFYYRIWQFFLHVFYMGTPFNITFPILHPGRPLWLLFECLTCSELA